RLDPVRELERDDVAGSEPAGHEERRQAPGLLPGLAARDPPITFDDQGAGRILAGTGTGDVGQGLVPPLASGFVPRCRLRRAADEEAAHVPFEPPGHHVSDRSPRARQAEEPVRGDLALDFGGTTGDGEYPAPEVLVGPGVSGAVAIELHE